MKGTLNNYLALTFVVICSTSGWAQFRIPSMDASLKGGYSMVNGSSTDFEGVIVTGSLMIHINEHIAVGPFISQSIDMNFFENEFGFEGSENLAEQSMFGINARFSTSRSKVLRPYLNLSYYSVEMVEDFGGYRLAQKTTGLGGGIGLMIRLNRNLYLNAVEVNARQIKDDIFFLEEANLILELQAGISYNIGRKK